MAGVRADQDESGPTLVSAPSHPEPVAITDFLLALLLHRRAVAVQMEPGEAAHRLSVQRDGSSQVDVTVASEVGDAVAVRLALLAGIDLPAGGSILGRIKLRWGDRHGEILVVLGSTPAGITLELRKVLDTREAARVTAAERASRSRDASRIDAYKLHEILGRGGTGLVYRAEHEALQKQVALKVLHPRIARSPEAAAMLLREGRAASRIRHRGIVEVTDFGTAEDGRLFLVMELVTLPTLQSLMAVQPMPPDRVISIIRNLLLALDAAHGAGLIHRDLKPSNVFVGPDDEVKITDFGSAVALAEGSAVALAEDRPLDGSQNATFWATRGYLAPEYSLGRSSRRSDIYAVGCIMYLMLAGRLPEVNKARPGLFQAVDGGPSPPMTLADGSPVPPLLEAAVRKATAVRPSDRYETAQEMSAELERVRAGLKRRGWQRWLPA
jgi:tRNA A-37 threonylcarbamoyl transferase component Bud32